MLGLDEAKLAREAAAAAERIRAATAETRAWAEQVAPHVACHCRVLAKRLTRAKRLISVAAAGSWGRAAA